MILANIQEHCHKQLQVKPLMGKQTSLNQHILPTLSQMYPLCSQEVTAAIVAANCISGSLMLWLSL